MIAIIFALIVLLTWGTGDIFTTIAARKIGSYNATFYSYLIGGLFSIFYIPFALGTLSKVSLSMILLTALLAIIQLIGFFSYNEALKIGNSSIVGTIGGAFTSLVVIFSLIFFRESLTLPQTFAIIVIFAGLFFTSINFSSLKKRQRSINKSIIFALVAMLGWAIYFTFIKIPVQQVGFFWPSFITNVVDSAALILIGIKQIKKPQLKYNSGFPPAVISAVLLTAGSFSFNFAIDNGLSSIVAPISGAYPALFALLAYFIFKDPISHQQKFGMVITLVGIILLAYFSR